MAMLMVFAVSGGMFWGGEKTDAAYRQSADDDGSRTSATEVIEEVVEEISETESVESESGSAVLEEEEKNEDATPHEWQVAGWLPTSWDVANSQQSWEDNKELLNEVNPIWYKMCIDDKNEIASNHGAESEAWLKKFSEAGVRVVPMISNSSNRDCLSRILRSDEERAQHISDLVAKVDQFDFDGIDVDYEKVDDQVRDLFTIFIAELASELHDRGKILSIAVHPQKSGNEDWDGPGGQDWERLGGLVDEFKIMAYDHHWLSGDPGPIAPLPWVEEVVDYAITTIPLQKIFLGVPFYAYDWPVDGDGNRVYGSFSRSWRKIEEDLCQKYSCDRQWLPVDATPLIKYFSKYDNRDHLLYYENARSLSHRLDLARENGLGGIAIWRMGSEDPDNWRVIAEKFRHRYEKNFDDCRQVWFEAKLALGAGEELQNPALLKQCHAANKMHELELLQGDGSGSFLPEVPLSRAQLLKIAFVAHDVDEQSLPTEIAADFTDVGAEDWFAPFVNKAKYDGWVRGYPDKTFRPNREIARAEAIKIFFEVGGFDIEADEANWSAPYWERAAALGLSDDEWRYNEWEPMTRGEAALLLARYLAVE